MDMPFTRWDESRKHWAERERALEEEAEAHLEEDPDWEDQYCGDQGEKRIAKMKKRRQCRHLSDRSLTLMGRRYINPNLWNDIRASRISNVVNFGKIRDRCSKLSASFTED
jgi:hypothetical protein